jgi:pimeloyl-ACP methyl ester carboxylesterase
MPYCEVSPGVRIYYEDFGAGDPIVFICGAHLTHKSWESQVAAFTDKHRTIAFDWRGTGASDKPRTGYTGEIAAADIHALMKTLAAAPAVLVGHGLGAHLALMVAEKRPESVRGLFLTGAAPWFSGERDGMVGGVSEEFLDFMLSRRNQAKRPYAETCFELGDKWVFHRRQSPGVYHAMLEQALEWPEYVINEYAESLRSVDHRARAGLIRCPTVIAQGRHDRKQRYEGAIHLARMISGAQLVTLEESGTMANVEEVDRFNAALRNFVQALQRTRQAA